MCPLYAAVSALICPLSQHLEEYLLALFTETLLTPQSTVQNLEAFADRIKKHVSYRKTLEILCYLMCILKYRLASASSQLSKIHI